MLVMSRKFPRGSGPAMMQVAINHKMNTGQHSSERSTTVDIYDHIVKGSTDGAFVQSTYIQYSTSPAQGSMQVEINHKSNAGQHSSERFTATDIHETMTRQLKAPRVARLF